MLHSPLRFDLVSFVFSVILLSQICWSGLRSHTFEVSEGILGVVDNPGETAQGVGVYVQLCERNRLPQRSCDLLSRSIPGGFGLVWPVSGTIRSRHIPLSPQPERAWLEKTGENPG